MTTGEALLVELASSPDLVALVGSRIYPNRVPMGSKYPAIRYQVVSDLPNNTFTTVGGTTTVRVQVDCYSPDNLAAQAVAQAVRDVLENLSRPDFSAWRDAARDSWDDVAELVCCSADYFLQR